MNQNSMLTVVIPTYNRPAYLKRLLGYYNECQLTHQIIIADGSSDEIREVNRETINSFSTLHVLHLDKYSAEIKFNERITDALKHVSTKYCVICADDDFITPKGMDQSVDFLEGNPDYSVCHGKYIFFTLADEDKDHIKLLWRTIYSNQSIEDDNPAVRSFKQLSEYPIATFYAVHKTEFIRWLWDETLKNTNETDALFSEMLLSTLTLVYGKMKCLDMLYSVKDSNFKRAGYIQTFKDYQTSGTYKKQYTKFRQCLATHLHKQSQLSRRKAKNLIDKGMAVYMKLHYPRKKRSYSFRKVLTLDYFIMAAAWIIDRPYFPDWLRKRIRSSNAKVRSSLGLMKIETSRMTKAIEKNEAYEKARSDEQAAFESQVFLEYGEELERIKQWVLSSIKVTDTQ